MSDHHEANDRAMRRCEEAYLREPAWRTGEDGACQCGAPTLPDEAYCAECLANVDRDEYLVSIDGSEGK
jgi:hypothetical protein